MVTNLKKGKKIRAFCYRMMAVGALLTTIATAIMGREALGSLMNHNEVPFSIMSGEMYYLPEFREYISELYYNAMVGYAGIGDDNGYPLTDSYAQEYSHQALNEFDTTVKEAKGDILYYAKKPDGVEYSNVSYPLFSEYDGHLLLPEDVTLCCYWDGAKGTLRFFEWTEQKEVYYTPQYQPNKELAADMQFVLAVKDDCISPFLDQMERRAQKFQQVLIVLAVAVVSWLIFGILSLFTGKTACHAKEDYAKTSVKIWFEAKVVFVVLAIYFGCCHDLECFGSYLTLRMLNYDMLWFYFPLGCLLYLFYVDIRQNRVAVLLNSLPAKGFYRIKEFVLAVPWYRRAVMICTIMLVGGLFFIAAGVYLLVLESGSYYLHKHVRQMVQISGTVMPPVGMLMLLGYIWQRRLLKDTVAVVAKLSEMRAGKGQGPLVLSKRSLLASAARDLNELEIGIEKAVEEQNRSNKMKVELITNVSHDLKTPLTSIINYADLLCEEELPDVAADYAVALRGKAYRLKNMVQDVFDLSKATSGNLVVEKTEIDLVKLIKQTLADMDERIQESDLAFKLNIATEPLMIEADGEKLYRVFQNLFVNALQYSLEHSRVHVQLVEEDGFAVARVKNTSRMELDFDPAEIVERFVRADSSRTTEGSGLGLSIVQSFVEASGGQFMIETDADMFTACVRFLLV